MDLNQTEYSEWLHWCGYTDAEMYSWPLDNDPAYMAGFAEGYAELAREGYAELAREEAQCQNMYG